MADKYLQFKKFTLFFEEFFFISTLYEFLNESNEEELNLAMAYIDNNLKANLVTDQGYWYDMYSYSVKNYLVLKHKQKNNVSLPLTTLGECLCQEKVINFLKNTDKKCLCNKGCSSVYYNKVF